MKTGQLLPTEREGKKRPSRYTQTKAQNCYYKKKKKKKSMAYLVRINKRPYTNTRKKTTAIFPLPEGNK